MWQAARRWSTWTSSAARLLAVAGCGGRWQPHFVSSGFGTIRRLDTSVGNSGALEMDR